MKSLPESKNNQRAVPTLSKQKYLAEYNPKSDKLAHISTIPDIFESKTPSIARLKKEHGREFATDYLMLWVIEINEMVNIGSKMTSAQIKYTANLIVNEYPLMTVADIKYVFDKAMTGKYGELYNRIDSMTICGWFNKHWNERMDEAEQQSMSKHYENTRTAPVERKATEVENIRNAVHRYKLEQLKKKE